MFTKTIFFLLSLELVQLSVSKHHNQNDSTVPTTNLQKSANSFVLVNPNQVQHLEKTLQRFLSKMAEPIKGPIILRFVSSNGNDLQSTIRKVCESIRKRFMQFATDSDLMSTVRRYEQNSDRIPQSEDWSSEMLLQGAYILSDLGNMVNEIGDEIEVYFGKPNVSSQPLTKQANSFQFLGVIYDASDFGERLSQCLLKIQKGRKNKASFDINRAVFNMAKSPTNIALKTFKSNMNSSADTYPKTRGGYSSWHGFLCFSIVKEQGIQYNDCMRDLQQLETCLRSLRQRTERKMDDLEVKPWMKAIQQLSDCKIQDDKQGKVQIFCKNSRRMPKDTKQKIKYIFERTLNRKIPKKSPLHKAADDLANSLSESNWGQPIINELCQYFAIYEDGTRKLQRLSALASKNKGASRKYKEAAKALQVYKKGIILRTSRTVTKLHRSAFEFEKYLVNGIKLTLNETWQSHMRILSCMMDWMTKLLDLHVGVDVSENEQPPSNSSIAPAEWNERETSSDPDDNFESDSEQSGIARSKTDMMKRADTAMDNLMKSMNHVVKQRSVNNKSMLASLANNLLLVTMFMETMGFVSTLFCAGHPTVGEPNSLNHDEQWKRIRRSGNLLEYEEEIDPILEDYFLIQIYENLTTLNVTENN